jgi:hypothetical protein
MFCFLVFLYIILNPFLGCHYMWANLSTLRNCFMILISPHTVCVLKISNLNLSREMSLFFCPWHLSTRYPHTHQISLHMLINSQSNTYWFMITKFFLHIANRRCGSMHLIDMSKTYFCYHSSTLSAWSNAN